MGSPTPTPMESGQACLWVRFPGGGAAGLLGSHLITGAVWPENQRALPLPAGSVGSSRRWFWNPDPARVDEVLLSPHLEAGKSGISLGALAIPPWGSLRSFWKASLHFLPPPLPCDGSQGRAFAQGLMHPFPGWLPEPQAGSLSPGRVAMLGIHCSHTWIFSASEKNSHHSVTWRVCPGTAGPNALGAGVREMVFRQTGFFK